MPDVHAPSMDYFYFEALENQTVKSSTLHYHRAIEIYYLTSGICHYFIDNSIYTLHPGDLVIIPPNILHNTDYKGQMRSRFLITCDVSYIPTSLRREILSAPLVLSGQNFAIPLRKLFESIRADYEKPDAYFTDSVKSTLGTLLITLLRSRQRVQSAHKTYSFVNEAISYIHDNYSSSVTLTDVARHCMVCSEYLSRAFKKHTGFGFNEYLTMFRINKAESMLLRHPEKSVADIAYRCGFNDSNYFSSRFKRVIGMSPTQFVRARVDQREAAAPLRQNNPT